MGYGEIWQKVYSIKSMNRVSKKRIALLGILILIVLGIPLTILQLKKQQETRSKAGADTASVTLAPQTATASISQPFSVEVYLTTNKAVTGADVTISFTKDLLSASFAPTRVFNDEIINTVDNTSGAIRYVAVDTAGNTPTGAIHLGTITFTPISLGTATVNFRSIEVVATGMRELVLVDTKDTGSYSITTPPTTTSVLPNNTPIPTATPTPVLESTITPSPTGIETPTNTPTLSPTLTPSPTLLPSESPSITTTKRVGDANGDGRVSITDFGVWRDEFLGFYTTKTADFNNDGRVSITDFGVWRDAFLGRL